MAHFSPIFCGWAVTLALAFGASCSTVRKSLRDTTRRSEPNDLAQEIGGLYSDHGSVSEEGGVGNYLDRYRNPPIHGEAGDVALGGISMTTDGGLQQPGIRGGASMPTGALLFRKNSADLTPNTENRLLAIAASLSRNPAERVRLRSARLDDLSFSRATAVKQFLIQNGASSSQIDERDLRDMRESTPADERAPIELELRSG